MKGFKTALVVLLGIVVVVLYLMVLNLPATGDNPKGPEPAICAMVTLIAVLLWLNKKADKRAGKPLQPEAHFSKGDVCPKCGHSLSALPDGGYYCPKCLV